MWELVLVVCDVTHVQPSHTWKCVSVESRVSEFVHIVGNDGEWWDVLNPEKGNYKEMCCQKAKKYLR